MQHQLSGFTKATMISDVAQSFFDAVCKVYFAAEAITLVLLKLMQYVAFIAVLFWDALLNIFQGIYGCLQLLQDMLRTFWCILEYLLVDMCVITISFVQDLTSQLLNAVVRVITLMEVHNLLHDLFIIVKIVVFMACDCCLELLIAVLSFVANFPIKAYVILEEIWKLLVRTAKSISIEIAIFTLTCLSIMLAIKMGISSLNTKYQTRVRQQATSMPLRNIRDYNFSDDEEEHNIDEISGNWAEIFGLGNWPRPSLSTASVSTVSTVSNSHFEDESSTNISDTDSTLTISDTTDDSDIFDDDSDQENNQNSINVQLPERADAVTEHDFSAEKMSNSEKLCVICQNAPKNVLLLPCRHMCLCVECAHTMVSLPGSRATKCPLCRASVSTIMNVYF